MDATTDLIWFKNPQHTIRDPVATITNPITLDTIRRVVKRKFKQYGFQLPKDLPPQFSMPRDPI